MAKTQAELRALMEELRAKGIDLVNRSTHPMATASSWDVPSGRQNTLGTKADYRFAHIAPESILIAPIGNLWEEGCWWHLQDMMLHSVMQGHSISIQEMSDSSIFSHDAIGFMRWCAAMTARDSGVEWVLMVDNDALVEKDTLIRLLAHDRPIVFPLLNDLERKFPPEIAPISAPGGLEQGTGLVPVRWAAMSVMLFNPKIFNVLDSHAWWGTDYHFGQALNHLGHRIYVDTDTVVNVVRGPSRHSAKGYDEFWENHRAMSNRLHNEERNREPPPGFNPLTDDGWVDPDGAYFAVLNKVARGKTNGVTPKEQLWHP